MLRFGHQTGLIRYESRAMRELMDRCCSDVYESIMHVSVNQTANFGKIVSGLAELAPGHVFRALGTLGGIPSDLRTRSPRRWAVRAFRYGE